jgi:hypothetical protein
MKKLAIAIAALIVLVAFAGWNVWHAVYEPVTETPSLVDQGRQQLHAQLEQAKAREAEIEQQDWGTITLLRGLIQAHQHRIDQLKDNGQAREIVAHDQDAIARIEKRIADLQTQQAALPPVQADETAAGESLSAGSVPRPVAPQVAKPPSAAGTGLSHPAATQTAKPAPKTQPGSVPASVSPRPATPQATKPATKTQPAVPASPEPTVPQPQPQAR